MQRYRVNYALLIGLVVGVFLTSGASYTLWRYQVNRNATRLLDKANVAEAEGKIEDAFTSLAQYARLRKDEVDARRRLGEVAIKLANQDELDIKIRGAAYQTSIDAVKFTDDAKLRRQLVDLQVKYGFFDLALQNIDFLLDKGGGDAELKALKAQCLFAMQKPVDGATWCYRLVGYDAKAKKFDAAKAEAPHQPVVYALLSQYLRNNKNPELAQQVIDQMIAQNPESREANVLQYQFLKGIGKSEDARKALDKAYKLEPTDASVLASKGFEELTDYSAALTEAQAAGKEKSADADKHLAEAGKFFNEALERYPDRIVFYEQCAKIQLALKKQKEALAILEKGVVKFPLKSALGISGAPTAIALSNLKMDILIEHKDFAAVEKEIKALRDLNNDRVTPIADFNEARLAAINEKWAEAARRLADVKGRLLGFPELQAIASAIEGFCQQQLGNLDLALQAYDWALEINPNLPQAAIPAQQIRNQINPGSKNNDAVEVDEIVRKELDKPRDKQDWAAIAAKVDAFIDTQAPLHASAPNWVPSRKALIKGQMFVMRAAAETDEAQQKQLFAQAKDAIREANNLDPKDPAIRMAAIRLIAQEPGKGPQAALASLDEFIAKTKDNAQLRALRVDLLAAIHGDKLPEELAASTKGMDDWPAAQQALVWSSVANRYEQIGKYEDALRCLEKSIDLSPNSLPSRLALFDLALKQGDDLAMRRAQSRILEIVKREDDPTYVLSEVRRRMVGQQTGAATATELSESRKMLNDAIKNRKQYSDLYVASGQLYLMLEKDTEQALASFAKAIELGAANLNAVGMEIRLLADRGRMQEARKAMDRIPAQAWTAVLDRAAADVLLGAGETDRAFTEAEKIAKARSEDVATQVWFAELASKVKKPEAAEGALKKAIELNPSDPEVWTRLVGLYIQLKRPEDVERTLREAHLALDEEYLPLLTGKYYELQGSWHEAEDIYLAAYAEKAEDVFVARRLAEFYLTWLSKDEANKGKAAVYLNRILRAANEGKLGKDDPNRPWARIQAAKLLASTNEYSDSVKAERLLSAAVEGGTATPEVEDLLVDILSSRQDSTSRERAVALLRKIGQQRGLTAMRELQIGDVLSQLNNWDAAKKQMEDAIGRSPEDIRLQTAYISMLIRHKLFPEAQSRMSRLEGNAKAQAGLSQLKLELAAAQGQKEKVRQVLTGMTPNLSGAINEQQLKFLHELSQLADSVGDHEYALTLLREYARRAKGGELELARLTALYGNVDEGFAMLRQLMNGKMDDIVPIAVEVLRARRAEAPQKLDEEVSRIVRQSLRDDPESAKRMVIEGEMLEIEEKIPESIEAYKKILARDDVPKRIRAGAANNLAFLVAAQDAKPEDLALALKYVNEAIDVMGPISDILDTRALIYISQKQYADAVADMQQAVKTNATPSKYFHLAEAQLGAGDRKGAAATWELAKQAGLKPETISKLEQPRLQEFMKKMEPVGSTPQL